MQRQHQYDADRRRQETRTESYPQVVTVVPSFRVGSWAAVDQGLPFRTRRWDLLREGYETCAVLDISWEAGNDNSNEVQPSRRP